MTDCTTFHYDIERLGRGTGATAGASWHRYAVISMGAAVRGAPLYLHEWRFAKGPHKGKKRNIVIVATSGNYLCAFDVHALRAGSTTALWAQFLGTPVTATGSNIPPPLGVCSTPVIDRHKRRVYVIAFEDNGAGIGVYHIYAVDLDTGAVVQSAPLHDTGASGRPTFDGNAQDQRGALNHVGGAIVATFADFFGYDSGTYHGWVVSCNARNLKKQAYFSVTKNVLGGGCWGPGGAAAASDHTLYVGTGNATTADAAYWAAIPAGSHPGDIGDYFEGVIKLKMKMQGTLPKLSLLDWYQPTNAKWQNDSDLDFGSSSPLVLPKISGKKLVVISAKFGIYLLDRENLGHWGGELWKAEGVFPAESHSAPAYYRAPSGDHHLYFVGGGLPGLICYKVVVGGGGATLQETWRATGGGLALGNVSGSPTIGATEVPSYALVWIVDADESSSAAALRAFDALNGTEVFNSTTVASDALGPVPHYPPITCAGRNVFVGTSDGFACYGA
jgi:hypothetical protein